ncbi:MAG: thioredoxin family protein, partial [Gammaproteobacteria bacterium]|nr:thioredoxin family protein [Gammaproteobacteria bacterium]
MRSLSILLLGSLVVSLSACLEPAEGLMTVGSVAPEVRTRYLKDVDGDMSKLTTYRYPDERMYQYSIDQALKLGKPVVVEFATPGHCTVCDKQLQMLKAMIAKYGNDVIFLHMDQYKNPQAFTAFQVKGDPWTFIIDANRVVKFQRAGRMLYNEM